MYKENRHILIQQLLFCDGDAEIEVRILFFRLLWVGRIAAIAVGCKPTGASLRWFESNSAHYKRTQQFILDLTFNQTHQNALSFVWLGEYGLNHLPAKEATANSGP